MSDVEIRRNEIIELLYLSAKFSDEAIDALVKEMEGRHDE